jgi:poly-gamma-glutamate synthesis protein (capsule biosynthesis protein)
VTTAPILRLVRALVVLACVAALGLSSATAAVAGEPFVGSVSRIDAETRRMMVGSSWHRGCPVPIRALRLVRLTYEGFDGEAYRGRLVVHRRWADEVLEVFARLYRRAFPIRRVRLVDRFDADDRSSMRHDNTSAFNCRHVAGATSWSQHAYGRAIDINPVENPYVDGSHVSPRRGRRFLDRTDLRPGMIVGGGVVVRAFRRIGWGWGGAWSGAKDYQHLSATGR